jgi:hypothetical protein
MPKKKQAAMQAPSKLKLLITIVNREKADFYMDLIQSFDVNMQFRASARGTASTDILHMMGLSESEKAVIFSVIREDRVKAALEALAVRFATIKNGKGIAYTVPMSGMIGVSLYNFFADNRRAVSVTKEGK